jgi:hypothetical protein
MKRIKVIKKIAGIVGDRKDKLTDGIPIIIKLVIDEKIPNSYPRYFYPKGVIIGRCVYLDQEYNSFSIQVHKYSEDNYNPLAPSLSVNHDYDFECIVSIENITSEDLLFEYNSQITRSERIIESLDHKIRGLCTGLKVERTGDDWKDEVSSDMARLIEKLMRTSSLEDKLQVAEEYIAGRHSFGI